MEALKSRPTKGSWHAKHVGDRGDGKTGPTTSQKRFVDPYLWTPTFLCNNPRHQRNPVINWSSNVDCMASNQLIVAHPVQVQPLNLIQLVTHKMKLLLMCHAGWDATVRSLTAHSGSLRQVLALAILWSSTTIVRWLGSRLWVGLQFNLPSHLPSPAFPRRPGWRQATFPQPGALAADCTGLPWLLPPGSTIFVASLG